MDQEEQSICCRAESMKQKEQPMTLAHSPRTVNTAGAARKKKTARRAAPSRRAKRGEILLVTCGLAIQSQSVKESIADSLVMAVFEKDERILQVISTRIDGQKIYGRCQELYEAAPYMFMPVPRA